eukprot:757260-Hanusia_phi.AAC.2
MKIQDGESAEDQAVDDLMNMNVLLSGQELKVAEACLSIIDSCLNMHKASVRMLSAEVRRGREGKEEREEEGRGRERRRGRIRERRMRG